MPRPEIVLIAAIAEKNRVIGKNGALPWYLSEDLRRFKKLTLGHAVIMGRNTFESIVARLGKPLPERRSLVLTSKQDWVAKPGVETYASLQEALKAVAHEKTVFIIGGERVFAEALPLADRLELTIVQGDYEGDAFFPQYEPLLESEFQLVAKEEREGYRFETYRKKVFENF